jgi:hypothetical protein
MDSVDAFLANLFIVLSPKILWIIFILGLGILFMVSLALMYHWREYALAHHVKNVKAQKIYTIVTILMTLVSAGLLITYTIIS